MALNTKDINQIDVDEIHDNTRTEIIAIHSDRLKNKLEDFSKAHSYFAMIFTPLSICISTIMPLLTTGFEDLKNENQEVLISSDKIEIFVWAVFLTSLVFLIKSLINYFRYSKYYNIEKFIEKIKSEK